MTTYSKGYVATVRVNGQTIQESNGKLQVPFHTEYVIRLRNKTRKRAVADVYIDGRLVNSAGGLVIRPNDYVDLERFVEDLNEGKKLRFVPLEDGRVQDKGEPENGKIEVKFYAEKDAPPPAPIFPVEHHHHHHHDYHYGYPRYPRFGEVWCSSADNSIGGGSGLGGGTYSAHVTNTGMSGGILRSAEMKLTANASAGATVGGSTSNQSFGSTYVDVDRSNPVTIRLQLVGIGSKSPTLLMALQDAGITPVEQIGPFCTRCGKKVGKEHKFCAHCGLEFSKSL